MSTDLYSNSVLEPSTQKVRSEERRVTQNEYNANRALDNRVKQYEDWKLNERRMIN